MEIVENVLRYLSAQYLPSPYINVNNAKQALIGIDKSKKFDARPAFESGTVIWNDSCYSFRYEKTDFGWRVSVTVFSPKHIKPIPGTSSVAGQSIELEGDLDHYGNLYDNKFKYWVLRFIATKNKLVDDQLTIDETDEYSEGEAKRFGYILKIIFATMTFLNCRNIQVVDKPQFRSIARGYAKKGIPNIVYKELVVTPMGRKTESGSGQCNKGIMPLHLCRGHIKTFTIERPLFGRIVGQFFWHAQMRGNKENGEINKDYKLMNNC